MAKKIDKLKDVKKMKDEVNIIRKTILNLRFQKATGQLEKTSKIKSERKKLSQLLTKINENTRLKNA